MYFHRELLRRTDALLRLGDRHIIQLVFHTSGTRRMHAFGLGERVSQSPLQQVNERSCSAFYEENSIRLKKSEGYVVCT